MGIHPCLPRCKWEGGFVRTGRLVFVRLYALASFRGKKRGLIAAIKAFRVVSFRGRAWCAPGPGCNDEPRGKKNGRARTEGIEYPRFPVKDRLADSGEAARNSGRSRRAAQTRVTMLTGKTRTDRPTDRPTNRPRYAAAREIFATIKINGTSLFLRPASTEKPQIEIRRPISSLWTRVSRCCSPWTARLSSSFRRFRKNEGGITISFRRLLQQLINVSTL